MSFGHVEQVATNDDEGNLLRCPECGWLYLDPCDGLSDPTPIDAGDARSLFGYDV